MSDWLGYVLLRLKYMTLFHPPDSDMCHRHPLHRLPCVMCMHDTEELLKQKEPDMTTSLQVGDRVTRPSVRGGKLRIGVITDCYKSLRGAAGQQDDLFEVEWGDTQCRERGYLRVGLSKMD